MEAWLPRLSLALLPLELLLLQLVLDRLHLLFCTERLQVKDDEVTR